MFGVKVWGCPPRQPTQSFRSSSEIRRIFGRDFAKAIWPKAAPKNRQDSRLERKDRVRRITNRDHQNQCQQARKYLMRPGRVIRYFFSSDWSDCFNASAIRSFQTNSKEIIP